MLDLEQIEEGNKLIAQFMELNYQDYNTDWRVLMPVVEKIERLYLKGHYPFIVRIESLVCTIEGPSVGLKPKIVIPVVGKSKLEAIWLAVVYFIEWYNLKDTDK